MLLNFKLIALSLLIGPFSYGQANTVSSGGNNSGSGGSVSFTVGQIDYTSQSGTSGNVNQGVQQPYEIFAVSGIDELGYGISLTVGPNPTTDKLILTVQNPEQSELSYSLTDNNGKIVLSKVKLQQTAEIDLSTYPVGMYQLIVTNTSTTLKSYKIIKN